MKKACLEFSNLFKPIPWQIKDISKALNTDPVFSTINKDHCFTNISTDSRTSDQDQIFLALKGENFDGHTFIKSLIDKGIKGFVVNKDYIDTLDANTKLQFSKQNLIVFKTNDTLEALGKLAQYQRLRSNVKVLAITGSNGKTTTRKICEEIFKLKIKTHTAQKNFNNEIGLPLTLLNVSNAHDWAIVELGMNHSGEISRLSKIALPDIAIITNTADAHLEGLDTIDNVAKAKAEIFEGICKNGTAILPFDDLRREILEAKAKKKQYQKYSFFWCRQWGR